MCGVSKVTRAFLLWFQYKIEARAPRGARGHESFSRTWWSWLDTSAGVWAVCCLFIVARMSITYHLVPGTQGYDTCCTPSVAYESRPMVGHHR